MVKHEDEIKIHFCSIPIRCHQTIFLAHAHLSHCTSFVIVIRYLVSLFPFPFLRSRSKWKSNNKFVKSFNFHFAHKLTGREKHFLLPFWDSSSWTLNTLKGGSLAQWDLYKRNFRSFLEYLDLVLTKIQYPNNYQLAVML